MLKEKYRNDLTASWSGACLITTLRPGPLFGKLIDYPRYMLAILLAQ